MRSSKAVLFVAVGLLAGCSKSPDSKAQTTAPPAPAARTAPAAEAAPAADVHAREAAPAGGVQAAPAAGGTPVRTETTSYVIEVSPPGGAAAGSATAATIKVTPKTGWHLNQDFPTSVEVAADGVALDKASLGKPDAARFAEEGADWQIRFTPASAGDKAFTAKLKFAVCTATTCDPKRETLAWVVAVK